MTEEHSVFSGAQRADDFVEVPVQAGIVPRQEAAPRPEPVADEPAPAKPEPTLAAWLAPAPEPSTPAVTDPAQLLAAATPSAATTTDRASGGERASRGWRGALARVGLPVAPSAQERAELEAAHTKAAALDAARRVIRQATWTRAVAVLVGNQKGGVGKTPLALALGGMLAAIRGGRVAIVEVSDDPGALGYRAEGTPQLGLGEFVRDVDQLTTAGQVAGYTAPQTSFASVIGTVEGHRRPPLTYDAVSAVAAKLDEFFEVRVMDSGNQPTSGAFRGAVDNADVLVLPVMLAGDSTLEALTTLRELRTTEQGSQLADSAIAVVMDDGRPVDERMAEAVVQALTAAGIRTIHRLPYDAHIAQRGELTVGELNEDVRDALTLLGADVIRAMTKAAAPRGRRQSIHTTEKENA